MQGLTLDDSLIDAIEGVLDQLLSKIPSCSVLLADISGRLISVRNAKQRFNPTNLAALTAGNMAATTEIARQIGEERPFQLIFHEGEEQNIYLSDIAGNFLLVVVFDNSIQIGVVRLFTRQAIKELLHLVEDLQTQQTSLGVSVNDQFSDALSAEMEDVFGDWN
jgi:predicted regulator of Ras-like GTPase activity (Roadblock/LC7/MglB family)